MTDTAIASEHVGEKTTLEWSDWEPSDNPVETLSPDESSSTPESAVLRHMAMQLPKTAGDKRDQLRRSLISAIMAPLHGESTCERIEAVLAGLLTSKQPGRLDEAIDILSEAGPELENFVTDACRVNSPEDSDPDFWYVLIRALGRITADKDPHFMVDYALESGKRHLMEAAVLALGQRTDGASRCRLRELASGHPSAFIRDLAAETLEDCEA